MAMGIFWCIEQPDGSLMQEHPRFAALLERFVIYRKFLRMGSFGAQTAKGTWLYTDQAFIKDIDMFATSETSKAAVSLVDYNYRNGKRTVDGNSRLKGSQEYSHDFGMALALLWRCHADELFDKVRAASQNLPQLDMQPPPPDCSDEVAFHEYWPDTDLHSVANFLGVGL